MTSWIRASLIFLQILGQVCRGEFKYCQEAVDNVESVTSCPTSEKEWESAAKRKNCQSTAAQQTCSEPETFLYHCVINGYGNETIEVCAPRRLMIGYCTEFNVAGGVIQSHVSAPCNKTSVLTCDNVYYSTRAYKYPGCYDIVYKKQAIRSTTITMPDKTTRSDQSKNRNTQITVAVVVAATVVIVFCIAIAVIGVLVLKRRKTRTPDDMDNKEMETLITDIDDNRKGLPKFKDQNKVIEEENEDPYTSGQPIANALGIHSDSVDLQWAKPENSVDYYQIRYKTKDGKDEWKFAKTDTDQSKITITGLMANTKYVFQVRTVYQDQEGQYGPQSNDVLTAGSPSTSLLDFSKQVRDGNPAIYQLLAKELRHSRNVDAKTKQLILGEVTETEFEKTIILVGATGSGKSTLVDAIVNYVMGVNFDDPFRFALTQLEDEEYKTYNQAVSQTEWITVYRIMPRDGNRLTYTLNIIDTPGFGDARGIDRDQHTIDHIRQLFSETGANGILFLDAVCFVVRAPDARLTVYQRYIFSLIMSLFGKDIESNICTLITFDDGGEPPVIPSLKEADIPFGSTFQFNNSALFAENKNVYSTALSPIFWNMSFKSFKKFFEEINHFKTKNLSLTRDVLQKRDEIKYIIHEIHPQIKSGLVKLSELRDELDLLKEIKNDIESNKDFEYEVEEVVQTMVQLDSGHYVTNCLNCLVTCHSDCNIADNSALHTCSVMNYGYCTVCPEECHWTVHKNVNFNYTYEVIKKKKTYEEMKRIYEEAIGRKLTHESLIENISLDVKNISVRVENLMTKLNSCKSILKKNELRPDPLYTLEHLDSMIQAEKCDELPGYQSRLEQLCKLKNVSAVYKDCENFYAIFHWINQEIVS